MIGDNNNLSVLPFYTSTAFQERYKSYSYGDIYPLYTRKNDVLPFQFILEHSDYTIASVSLFRTDGTVVSNTMLQKFTDNGFAKYAFATEGYDVYVCPAFTDLTILNDEGQYFLRVGLSNGKYYYSEVFTVVGRVDGYVRVQWWDKADLVMNGCRIVYALTGNGQFKNHVYLATEIGKPDYVFEEEGETRDGLFFPEKMISEKTYRFTFLASEYLCDVMRFVRMSDVIKVKGSDPTLVDSGTEYLCDTFQMTPKWEVQGNLASVEVEFQTNTVAKKIGRDFT